MTLTPLHPQGCLFEFLSFRPAPLRSSKLVLGFLQ